MSPVGVSRTAVAVSILLLALCGLASADIYRYQDEEGVWHFTNIRQDYRYRLYIRSTEKTATDYIRKYDDLIRKASKQFGIGPSLIKAVIKAESDFDHRAVSVKGAQGLMQLMPETASDMEVADPLDPESNIIGGTRYLSILLKRFSNDKELALAAYNAGPERVESCGGIPPIPETETFVKRVMAYYASYSEDGD